MLRGLLICLLLPGVALAQTAGENIPAELRVIYQGHDVNLADVGILVQAVDATEPVLAVNTDSLFNPASTIKLLTTWLGLETLGPAWTWPTEVYVDGTIDRGTLRGDLILKGYGDPYFVTERLWSLQRQLQLRGIRRITGDLVIDNGYFAGNYGNPDEFDGEGLRVYNVLPDAMLVNFQAMSLYFEPDPPRNAVRVYADPMPANLALENRLQLRPGRCGGYNNGVSLQVEGGSARDRLVISGNYGADCELFVLGRSVLTGPTHAYGVFRTLWEESGGSLDGGLRIDAAALQKLGAAPKPFLRVQSPPLADVIRYINKYSNNVMSRHMFLTLGAEMYGAPATLDKARKAAIEVLRERGIAPTGLRLDNGAGLSRNTRISARLLGDVLQAAYRTPWQAEYVSSLSLAGLDGTMRRRFRAEDATGRMHLKTGRLDNVFATAGYVHAQSGRDYVVVLIQNFPDADRGPGEEAQSALLRWVYEQ